MAVEHIHPTDSLNTGRVKLNAAIDQSNEAIDKANNAVTTATHAKNRADNVQEQLNQIVIEGDSSVEAAQARVDADGNTYTTLKERLDTKEQSFSAQLAQNARKGRSVEEFGIVGIGDETIGMQTAIDSITDQIPLIIPAHLTINVSKIILPSNFTLIIFGKLKKVDFSSGPIIENSDFVNGNSNVKIIVYGEIDGNKENQDTVVSDKGLIHFEKVDRPYLYIKKIHKNYFPNATDPSLNGACVFLKDCKNVLIDHIWIENYAREGVWLKNCSDSDINNIWGFGGIDSWSTLQVSGGTRNRVNRIRSKNAGASGISIDSTYSTVSDCLVVENKYFNGFNFGHEGMPADYTVVINCISINAGILESDVVTNPANGFNVVSQSKELQFSTCLAIGAKKHGFNVSDGATKIKFSNCKATGCGDKGLNIFGAEIQVDNCDFRGNTIGPFGKDSTSTWDFTNVRLSDDPTYSSQSIAGLGANGSVTVQNKNVTNRSKVVIQPSNLAGLDAMPYLAQVNDGNFVITTKNSGAGGANVRYWIM